MEWSKLFQLFGLGNPFKNIWYRLDWRKPNASSVQEFLGDNISQTIQLMHEGKLPTFTGTQDEIVLKILRWVKKKLIYEADSKRFKVAEKWQTVVETITFNRGDCEDGAILIYCMARAHRVSAYAIRVVAGDVQNPNDKDKTVGHCWVTYYPDEFFATFPYVLDWCYYYDKNPFIKAEGYNRNLYISEWFNISYSG